MPTTFANTIDGNEILAKRSQCDYAGNDIQTTYATKSEVTTGLSGKQDTISDLATIRSGAADGATAVQPGDLATVATTGAYSDLSGTPTIPTATSDLTNDSGFITLSDVPAQVNADWNSSSGASEILNKPTIPSGVQLVPAATSTDADKVLTVDSLGVPGWAIVPSQSTGLFQAEYGTTSYADIVQAINDKKIVYCRLNYGASRMAFLAYIGTSNVEFQYYRSLNSHSASNMTDEVYVYTVSSTGWTTVTRKTGAKVVAGTHMSQSYSNDTLTLNCTWPDVDQVYDASSANAQSGVAVASAIAGVNAVPASTSADADKVLTVDSQGTPAWASAQAPISAGNGIDITNNVVSVDTSVVATQTDLAGKEDAFDVGTGLKMDTSGATPTLQVEAPVDIVAGPGIAIDNPDGNTMRITNTGFPISATDAVLCGTFRGDPMYTKTYTFTGTVGTSETTISMSIDEKKGTNNVNRIWIDPSTSFIVYGSAGNNFLPLSWRLGSSRQGSVAVLGASTGSLSCRCVDTSSTPITLNITIRYTVSNS